jgi:nucleoside-diphosphate-sugar epimerase
MSSNIALIAGATGAVGSALARQLARAEGWKVLGISRRAPRLGVEGVSYIQADLGDPAACTESLTLHPPVTHVFYCARATHFEQTVESAGDNLRLFEMTLSAVENASENLGHVHLVQGGKYYGVHLGPFPTPARESQDRCVVSNFYYDQQDLLTRRARGARWAWSASRPNTLLHFSPRIARNIVSTLGAYAAICRASGAALDFPGPPGAYSSLTQVTSIEVLARAMERIATAPSCADQAFNVTNTDVFRWSSIWTQLADACDVKRGSVRPLRLAEMMADKDDVWAEICARHRLRCTKLSEVANWAFADATLERYWDEILCHNRARQHGLDDWDDSPARFLRIIGMYRRARILP